MKINFNQQQCSNFNLASNREWLEINKTGVYASSTIYGLNNRRYHGLLVIPHGRELSKTILLSKFEESVFIEKHVYELSTNQFKGGIYPDGFKYIRNFSIDPFPKTMYEIEERRVEKTVLLCHDRPTLIIRYTCKDQGPAFNLVLKPMLAARRIDDLTHEISSFNADSYLEDGVVKFTPVESLPELKIYYQKGEYIPAPLWYHNYVYEMDSRRKYTGDKSRTEDLFNPGFFSVWLNPYETFELFVSTEELKDFDYESIYRQEKEYRMKFDPAVEMLQPPAGDISKKIDLLTIENRSAAPLRVADYPDDEQETGQILFALFGLAGLDRYQDSLARMMIFLAGKLNKGLFPASLKDPGTESVVYLFADLPLIFMYLVYYLYDFRLKHKFIEEHLLATCLEIVENFSKGNNDYVYQDKDGLLICGDRQTAASWLLSHTANENNIRCGKLCEINALWYNALKIAEFLCRKSKRKRQANKYASMADKTRKTFLQLFWESKKLQYADHIFEDQKDMTFSITQLFLIGLPFSMLEEKRGTYLIKQIEEYLLTTFGLRSLSPQSKYYKGRLSSPQTSKESAHYTGSIWPWMIGIYVDAVLAFKGNSKEIIGNLNKTVSSLEHFFVEQGLGNISEFFEGNPPHRRNGKICSGLNLTELLRSLQILHRAKKEREGFSEYV